MALPAWCHSALATRAGRAYLRGMTAGAPLVEHIPLDKIRPSPRNPRRGPEQIAALAESIRAYGLLQPLVVRRRRRGYELVAGHRRLAALRQLGWETAPAIVRVADEDEAYVLALVENLQREDLSPREEADALADLVRTRRWTTRQVAQAIKRSAAYVSKRLRVFEDPLLSPPVMDGRLLLAVAEELLVAPPRRRATLVEQAIAEGWDSATARRMVGGATRRAAPARRASLAHDVALLRQKLRDLHPVDLTERERRALRLLFRDLGLLARAPAEGDRHKPIIPPMVAA
jgi:ParB family transcriptional regulator, chromosome partitioning protein